MIIELNEENFDKNIKDGLKLVEFYAPWCTYCKRQDLVFEELPNIWVGKINGEKSLNLSKAFNIQGYPSFVLFKGGKILAEFSGYHDKNNLLMKLVNYIG